MRPIVLTILDGWGYSKQKIGNAIFNARTPNIKDIAEHYPSLLLQASGKAVGMTWGESGNSEVGHLTIGAGRIIFQYLSRINKAIENGSFMQNPVLLEAAEHVKNNKSKLHIVGLLTSGSVHAYLAHIFGLMNFAKINGIDLAILRQAVYELMIEKEIPPKVVVDEAVEIAKEYGSESSPGFINGALGKLITDQNIQV